MSSGIGNSIFCLPAIKKLRTAGARITLFVDGDYDMTPLWNRCAFAERVLDGRWEDVPQADFYISGHWCPRKLRGFPLLMHARWLHEPVYECPEWELPCKMIGSPGLIDVSNWCSGLHRTVPRFDVGLVNGCKPSSVWARKRYPAMGEVSKMLRAKGLNVAAIGVPMDTEGIDDTQVIGNVPLVQLPEHLAMCRVIVGIDSGQVHMASSLGVPTVVLYTAVSAMKGDPVGRPTYKLHTNYVCQPCVSTPVWHKCTDWKCQGIDPAMVVEVTESLLKCTP